MLQVTNGKSEILAQLLQNAQRSALPREWAEYNPPGVVGLQYPLALADSQ